MGCKPASDLADGGRLDAPYEGTAGIGAVSGWEVFAGGFGGIVVGWGGWRGSWGTAWGGSRWGMGAAVEVGGQVVVGTRATEGSWNPCGVYWCFKRHMGWAAGQSGSSGGGYLKVGPSGGEGCCS